MRFERVLRKHPSRPKFSLYILKKHLFLKFYGKFAKKRLFEWGILRTGFCQVFFSLPPHTHFPKCLASGKAWCQKGILEPWFHRICIAIASPQALSLTKGLGKTQIASFPESLSLLDDVPHMWKQKRVVAKTPHDSCSTGSSGTP